jgi:condensation domain-containing protein/phosphopantetheine binding protein/AMP-binding enzyme
VSRERSFPLSQLQHAIYLDVLAERVDALHITQSAWELSGPLDVDALSAAWETVVARHEALRTAIDASDPARPIQFVSPDVNLDLERIEMVDEDKAIEEFLTRQREQPLSLDDAPAFRVTLVRIEPARSILVWTYSHLLVDGWSAGLVVDEVTRIYASLVDGGRAALDEPGRFSDYVAWLATLDSTDAELFWAEALAGRSGPTPLPTDAMLERFSSPDSDAGTPPFFSAIRTLDTDLTDALDRFARETGVTVSTVVQGAWALLLGAMAETADVVIGVITSGRPFELENVESTVGMFSDAVPFRTDVRADQSLSEWLRDIHRGQGALLMFQHQPPSQLPGWREIVRDRALFHSAVGFQNQPFSETDSVTAGALTWRHLDTFEPPQYPLHLSVDPAAELVLHVNGDTRWFYSKRAEGIVAALVILLRRIVEDPAASIGSLLATELDERDRALSDRRDAERKTTLEVNGFRTTAEELEAILQAHPDVASAAVVQASGGPIDAYAVATDRDVDASGLRSFAAARVPAFLVPRSIDVIDSLPVEDGVLDRAALAEAPATRYEAPRTRTERILSELWAEALGLERVGIHDNFFELGGESLAAMLIASRGEALLGSKLPMKLMLQLQTVAAVAEAVDRG